MACDKQSNGHRPEALNFPCEFPVKVMGKRDSNVKASALKIIVTHCPDYTDRPTERLSRDNTYISLTFNIYAHSKAQLDAIYTALTKCEEVMMAL